MSKIVLQKDRSRIDEFLKLDRRSSDFAAVRNRTKVSVGYETGPKAVHFCKTYESAGMLGACFGISSPKSQESTQSRARKCILLKSWNSKRLSTRSHLSAANACLF